ncbi:MAG TPA: (2Fe-2S)-binding protein [Burkholderiales bacterium]|jgi:bacterioferritin-associated ferredoxin|nr:(2Fe-2S)-binding protein [Burkholderiales bacterium]
MYVCICAAVTERQIRACAQDGATSMQDLREKLCVAGNCGKCARHAKTILREVHGAVAPGQSGAILEAAGT